MNIHVFPLMSLALLAGASPALAAPGANAAQCPGATFDAFLSAFTESSEVQRANTAVPLISRSIDPTAQPEPTTVTKTLSAGDLRFPVMPDSAARQREKLTLGSTRKADGTTQVKLSQSDTGYQIFYTFRPKGSCWSLVEVNDESL